MLTTTDYGRVHCAESAAVFEALWTLMEGVIDASLSKGQSPLIGLSGGATPWLFIRGWFEKKKLTQVFFKKHSGQ